VGKSWKSYAEDIPSVGYTGDDTGRYAVRHNPLAYFTDVQNDTKQVQNLVPFSQFATDLNAANLPDFSFIVPNLCNDAHDCSLGTSDTWLKTNIDPLIQSPQFQKDGLLIIVFDEADTLDFTSGGGHVAAVIVSPLAKRGYKSIAFYQHQSVLRVTLEGLGVTKLPGHAATAAAMGEAPDGIVKSARQESFCPLRSEQTKVLRHWRSGDSWRHCHRRFIDDSWPIRPAVGAAPGTQERHSKYLLEGGLELTLSLITKECQRAGLDLHFSTAWEMRQAVDAAERGDARFVPQPDRAGVTELLMT
jgi:Phosphoesterase family